MKKHTIAPLLLLLSVSAVMAQETADTVLIVNEVQSANIDQYLDNANCYGGWIELYNPMAEDISLQGFILTDGTQYRRLMSMHGIVPAGGFKTLWFDHNQSMGSYGTGSNRQIPFKLESEGGTISLLASDSTVISSVTYPQSIARCSWARTSDGGEEWGMTAEPTPEASNATSHFSQKRLPSPVVSANSRVFTESFNIQVKIPAGRTLRYTTDGSTPTLTNGETSTNGRFNIKETTVLRFCFFQEGFLPSAVVTRTYIYANHPYYLPILSVVSEPKNFFDDKVGVFVKGTNGVTGNGQTTPCNWNMDWERPVNMEYLVPEKDADGNLSYSMKLNQEMDLEICGGWTRAYGNATVDGRYWEARSSFRLKTDKKYEGVASIDYPVFPFKPYNKYRSWQVRNGGNDTYARIKDPAIQTIVLKSGFYVDCQDYQPAHVFLNGMYYGMLNIRESNNKHFAYSNYGIDFDDMDQFDLSNATYNQKMGDRKAWTQLQSLASRLAILRREEIFMQVCDLLDIDEYINYMALECYMGPNDWLTNTNNIKAFRSRTDGKFHFVLFDTDSAFGTSTMLTDVLNTGAGANVDDLFRNLMKYEPFLRRFIDAYCIVDGSVFEPKRCEEIIRTIQQNINPALAFENGNAETNLTAAIRSASGGARINTLSNHYKLTYKLYSKLSANIPEAKLSVNGQEIPTGKFSGYLFSYKDQPILLSAKAPAGYNFVGWKKDHFVDSVLIPSGAEWKYFDRGSMDGHNWKDISFNEEANGWQTGMAPFGYGRGEGYLMEDYTTTKLDRGSDAAKRPTYYFRNTFRLDFPLSDDDIITFNYQIDDGLMVYVNGHEVGGYCVNSGAKYDDFTTDGHFEGDIPYMGTIVIPREYLLVGDNQITVEAKNCPATSSDMWFDASLSMSANFGDMLTESQTIDLHEMFDTNSKTELRAVFQPVIDEQERWAAGAAPLRINEVSSGNDIYINDHGKKSDWVELYNTTDHDIPLAGLYLSDNHNKPQKFQMQEGLVPAHGTCVIWCDDYQANGQLHAPFKLSNADGAYVSIQAADGSWADGIEYPKQGKWQTYGRYPDGGNMLTILNQPTIGKSNHLGMSDFILLSDSDWLGPDRTITLELAEGWNWTSHNMARRIDVSRFYANALCFYGQTDSLMFSEEEGWQGNLQSLRETRGYKIKMSAATSVTLRGEPYNTEVPVTLRKGWNWIGCPLPYATALEDALADYLPQEGDKLTGFDAFATYENGKWHGSLTILQPGQAYLFYTSEDKEFCWGLRPLDPLQTSPRGGFLPRKLSPSGEMERDLRGLRGSRGLGGFSYPDVMTLIASVEADEEISLEEPYCVGAFCGDECRGIGILCDGLLYMNIHGEGTARIDFRLLTADGEVYNALGVKESNTDLAEGAMYYDFKACQQLGTVQKPLVLRFLTKNIIDEIKPAFASANKMKAVRYFNLSGQTLDGKPEAGQIYIKKEIFEDGRTRVTKIMH